MAVSRHLESLLRELRSARSPLQRMRLVARAWRTVQRLTPAERKDLAARVGVKGFEHVLGKLGREQEGVLPAEVVRFLERAETVDPQEAQRWVRGLRDPEHRKRLLHHELEVLKEGLPDGAVEEEHESEEEASPEESPEERTERTPEPQVAVSAPSPPAAAPFTASEPVPPEPTSGQLPEPAPPQPSEPRSAEVAKPAVNVVAPGLERARTWREEPLRAVMPPEAYPQPADEATALTERLAASTLVERLRLLRGYLGQGYRFDGPTIRSLLDRFPQGWARRRALCAILEVGLPEPLEEAVDLLSSLDRPGDRRWCAATLARARGLGPDEARRLRASS